MPVAFVVEIIRHVKTVLAYLMEHQRLMPAAFVIQINQMTI